MVIYIFPRIQQIKKKVQLENADKLKTKEEQVSQLNRPYTIVATSNIKKIPFYLLTATNLILKSPYKNAYR